MSKIICIGSATKDIFFPTRDGVVIKTPQDLESKVKIAFELGAKYQIEEMHETLGGCAVNVAAGLAKIGHDAHCDCALGGDALSQWIGDEIVKAGIGDAHIRRIEHEKGDFSFIFVECLSGERTIFTYHGSSKRFKFSPESIRGYDWVFVGDLGGDWQRTLSRIIDSARANDTRLAFNPRQQMIHTDVAAVGRAISSSAALFVNKDEAIEIVTSLHGKHERIDDERFLMEQLRVIGAEVITLTDGLRGAWCFDGEKMLHAKALQREAVDTTGSGDAFASGFLGSLLEGSGLEDALRWGIANSAGSVLYYGGQEGLLERGELGQLGNSVQLNIFDEDKK